MLLSALADVAGRRNAMLASISLIVAGIACLDAALFWGMVRMGLLALSFPLLGLGQRFFEVVSDAYVADLLEERGVGTKLSEVLATLAVLTPLASSAAMAVSGALVTYWSFHASIALSIVLCLSALACAVTLKEVRSKRKPAGNARSLMDVISFFREERSFSLTVAVLLIASTGALALAHVWYQVLFAELRLPGLLLGLGLVVLGLSRSAGGSLAKALLKRLSEEKALTMFASAALALSAIVLLFPRYFAATLVLWFAVAYALTPIYRSLILNRSPSRARASIYAIFRSLPVLGAGMASLSIAQGTAYASFPLFNLALLISVIYLTRITGKETA